MKNRCQENGKTVVLVTFCFFLTLLGFPIIHSFIINQLNFQSLFKDILLWATFLTLFSTIFFSAILLLFKTSIHKRIMSLTLAISILIWFQGHITVWQYGTLDGSAIPWNTYWVYGTIDTSIWILILFLAIIKSSFFYRVAQPIATALILIQLVSVTATYFQTPKDSLNFKRYVIDERPKFNFSQEKNVILIVLDEFQSDIFQEIINQDEGYKRIFDGFIYFRNSLAPFSYTELSIPAILTSKFYDNSVKRNVYLKNAFFGNSIPKILKENGFEVDLFPWKGAEYREMYFDESICSNLNKSSNAKEQLKETLLLFDISLFRYLPHFLKKYIYNNNQWYFSRRLPTYYIALKKYFIKSKNGMHKEKKAVGTSLPKEKHDGEKLIDSAISETDGDTLPKEKLDGEKFIDSAISEKEFQLQKNVFKFYHLMGVHVPLRMNEKSEIVNTVEYNKINYTRQAKAYLEVCKKFFDILKQEGAYNNCLIFIIGDHGSGRSEDMYINPVNNSHNDSLDKVSPGNNFQHDKARGIPLLLAKTFNSIDALKISDAPVSLSDIPRTIISEVGLKEDFPGISMFEIENDYDRKRYYGAFKWVPQQTDFIEPITMYVVDGFSWENESWNVLSILPPKN